MGRPKRDTHQPEAMIVSAKEFARTAIAARMANLPMGATANAAFACELMLKALSQMEQASYLLSHDLAQLFDDLPVEVKDTVLESFVEVAKSDGVVFPNPADRLGEILAANRKTFIDARYLFSKVSGSELLALEPIFPVMDALWAVVTKYRRAHGLRSGRAVARELDRE